MLIYSGTTILTALSIATQKGLWAAQVYNDSGRRVSVNYVIASVNNSVVNVHIIVTGFQL